MTGRKVVVIRSWQTPDSPVAASRTRDSGYFSFAATACVKRRTRFLSPPTSTVV